MHIVFSTAGSLTVWNALSTFELDRGSCLLSPLACFCPESLMKVWKTKHILMRTTPCIGPWDPSMSSAMRKPCAPGEFGSIQGVEAATSRYLVSRSPLLPWRLDKNYILRIRLFWQNALLVPREASRAWHLKTGLDMLEPDHDWSCNTMQHVLNDSLMILASSLRLTSGLNLIQPCQVWGSQLTPSCDEHWLAGFLECVINGQFCGSFSTKHPDFAVKPFMVLTAHGVSSLLYVPFWGRRITFCCALQTRFFATWFAADCLCLFPRELCCSRHVARLFLQTEMAAMTEISFVTTAGMLRQHISSSCWQKMVLKT